MKKTITLEVGNTSWWKNKKYRKEAAKELRDLRNKKKIPKFIKKYKSKGISTVIYADYEIL